MRFDTAIRAALDVMDAHMHALNAHDEGRLAKTLHFPHSRLSGTNLKTWETADTYFADFRARAGTGWARSSFDDIQVLQASADKVHLDAQVNRFGTEGTKIKTFRSLWVITCEEGHWAAKLRSSFAKS